MGGMTPVTLSKTSRRALRAFAFLFVPAMLVTACGGGPQAALPFAPSAIASSSTALEAADESAAAAPAGTLGNGSDKDKGGDKGDGDKGGNDKDKKKDGTTTTGTDATIVEIEGAVSSVTNVCPAKIVVVGLKTFVTAAGTIYKHGTCEQLLKDAVVEVHATTDADGRLVAKDVEFKDEDEDEEEEEEDDEDSGPNPHDGSGPFEGTVSSFRGTCPLVTFNLKGMTIVATSTTTYTGGTCEMLRPNVKVIVTRGPLSVGRVVMAATIAITRTPTGAPEPEDDEEANDSSRVEFRGYLQSLGAEACPSVTFTVGGKAVRADAHTDFNNGPCAHLENGTWIEVNGVRQGDGTVLASKIQMKEIQFTGLISTVDGVCPTRTLLVKGTTVKTDALTSFEKLLCTGFVKDLRVEVKGTEHSLGVVKAIRLKYEGE